MENSFQTSFIPKKPIIENGAGVSHKSTTSVSMVVSILILVIVCGLAGGLFFYRNYLEQNKKDLSSKLLKIKDSFDKDTIALLESYDKQSTVAKEVLGNHKVLSPLFEAINDYTLTSIQYTKFSYSMVNTVFTVKMSGVARDYKSIASQADVFSSNKPEIFKELVFSNLTKDKNNFVTFDVEFMVDPALLSYDSNVPTTTGSDSENNAEPSPVNMGDIVVPTLPKTTETQ